MILVALYFLKGIVGSLYDFRRDVTEDVDYGSLGRAGPHVDTSINQISSSAKRG